jgi:hypothetical protein
MSYTAGEALALTQVRAATGFSSTNTSRGNWSIRNSGGSDHYAILRQGEFTRAFETFRIDTAHWRTVIEVWQQYVDDGTSYTNLLTHVANLIARLDQYRKLADTTGTIQDANLTGGSAVMEIMGRSGDGPFWLKQDLYLDWSEESNVTFAE